MRGWHDAGPVHPTMGEMMAVRDLEAEFRAAVAELQAAKANKARAEAEYGQADCELIRARSIHAAARDRYLDAEFYKTGQPTDAIKYDVAREYNDKMRAAAAAAGPATSVTVKSGTAGDAQ